MKSEAIEYLPSELRSLDQWVTWQKVHLHGRWTKVPMNPRAGTHARSDDPQTWSSFDVAVEAQQAHRREGIGFVFTAGDPYVGIDLDQALDSSGAVLPWAASILEQLPNDVYVEISPSGRGLHAIVCGSKPGSRCRTSIEAGGGVEIYDQGRYFTMTGDRFGRWDGEVIGNGQTFLDSIYRQLLEPKSQPAATPAPSLESDSVLLDRMFRSRQGGKIEALWRGNTGGYPSASEADLALCSHLWFWTGGDTARIDSLFRSSGLMRPKWERADYREATIGKAGEGSSTWRTVEGSMVGPSSTTKDQSRGAELQIDLPRDAEPRCRNTHRANAWRLARHHGHELRYVTGLGWMVYDGQRWELSETKAIQIAAGVSQWVLQEAQEATQQAEASQDEDEQQRLSELAKGLFKWARTSEQGPSIRESLKLSRSLAELRIEVLDSYPHLLNVENGTLDLQNGKLLDHKPADFLTQLAPVKHEPRAQAPRWLAFIDEITGTDADLGRYLQKALGYSITGSTKEQILFFAFGDGQNGKSTLFNSLREVLGRDYVGRAAPNLLMSSKTDKAHPSEIADLRGLRIAISQEVGLGKSFDLQRVKDLTGERWLKARQLYGDWFEFESRFKIWMAGNHYPQVQDRTHSFWRRIHMVPFSERIKDPDPDLLGKLATEAAGILNWLIKGAQMYLEEGLQPTEEISKVVSEYRSDSDGLQQFIEDCCEFGPDLEVAASSLWEAYVADSRMRQSERLTRRGFKSELAERGVLQLPRRASGLFYGGLRLVSECEFEDQGGIRLD